MAALVCAVLFSSVAFAGLDDVMFMFSTPGRDYYADGTVVLDGECYALVWSPNGKNFAGFNADGTPVSSSDRVVLAGALALNGRCRDAIFQVPAEEYAELEGGEWAVCLVDTRMGNGVPAGVMDGRPLRVNRWGIVKGGVRIAPSSADGIKAAASASVVNGAKGASGRGVVASSVSAVPASLASPQITGLDVADGRVRLTVEGTVPFLTYTIVSGSRPGALREDYFADCVDGDFEAPVEIETTATGQSRFFKVIRAE